MIDEMGPRDPPGKLSFQSVQPYAANRCRICGANPVDGLLREFPLEHTESLMGNKLRAGNSLKEIAGQDFSRKVPSAAGH